jgi:hypothetical protein
MIRIGVPRLLVQVDQLDVILFLKRQVAVIFETVKRSLPGYGGLTYDSLLFVVRLQEIQYSPYCVDVSGGKLARSNHEVRLNQNLLVADRSQNVVLDLLERLVSDLPSVIAFYQGNLRRACGSEQAVLPDPATARGGPSDGGTE